MLDAVVVVIAAVVDSVVSRGCLWLLGLSGCQWFLETACLGVSQWSLVAALVSKVPVVFCRCLGRVNADRRLWLLGMSGGWCLPCEVIRNDCHGNQHHDHH